MRKSLIYGVMFFIVIVVSSLLAKKPNMNEFLSITKNALLDKIKGGWAGQAIGCTFGGPTEFKFQGTFIPDYQPISWTKDSLKWFFENAPGLYDDIYMDLTFVDVFERQGLDAPAKSFAEAFAKAGYSLWHANQAARYNILSGIAPPQSGYWLRNPHADDIDFQIEADFAGLMSPGMVNAAAEICGKIGHIMNYGDGYYGGVFVAAMYSLAFFGSDIHQIVEEALKVIPEQSLYAQTIQDVIQAHKDNPNDWKEAWFRIQKKWSEDVGCPEGVFSPFNIEAKVNSAWVVLGLLYGDGDFGKTISISARAGDDSDCNPATAGGILGTMLGYSKIPDLWRQGLSEVENLDFKYTTISLTEAYDLSFKHAMEMVKRKGGKVEGDKVEIRSQEPRPVPLEVGFEGHYPKERRILNIKMNKKTKEGGFAFEGIGFAVNGAAVKTSSEAEDSVLEVEMEIDGKSVERSKLPTSQLIRKPTPFWRYQLKPGRHLIRWKLLTPTAHAELHLTDVVIYGERPKLKMKSAFPTLPGF